MELPNDIWDIIIKNSTKTLEDYINEIDKPEDMSNLIDKLNSKKNLIFSEHKARFRNGDIVMSGGDCNKIFAIYNLNYGGCGYPTVKVIEVVKSATFGKWGYYEEYDSSFWYIYILKLTIVERRDNIDKTLYKYINSLKVGDTVRYNENCYNQVPFYTSGVVKFINKRSITLVDNIKVNKNKIVII